MNMCDLFRISVGKFPKKVAISDESGFLTYKDLWERTDRFASSLNRLGLKKGDKCAYMLYNCKEAVEVLFSLAKIGVIGVPVNFRFVPREIEYVVSHSDSKAFIFGAEFLERVKEIVNCNLFLDKLENMRNWRYRFYKDLEI